MSLIAPTPKHVGLKLSYCFHMHFRKPVELYKTTFLAWNRSFANLAGKSEVETFLCCCQHGYFRWTVYGGPYGNHYRKTNKCCRNAVFYT